MLPSSARARRLSVVTAGAALAISAALAARAQPVDAQQPVPPQPPVLQPQPVPTPQAVGYRLPVISLVQPATDGSIPQDRPVIVFRFFQGEPADPLEVSSFSVAVDGQDQTALFRITASEAWGPLADPAQSSRGPISVGIHQVSARICSSRGTCSTAARTVTVAASPGNQKATDMPAGETRRQRVFDLLLHAARKLLIPE